MWFVESQSTSFTGFTGILKFVNRLLYLMMCFVLKVLVFWNYFTSASFVGELVDLLLSLMEDSQIEVHF